MKKLGKILLALVLVFALSACQSDENKEENLTNQEEIEKTEEKEEETEEKEELTPEEELTKVLINKRTIASELNPGGEVQLYIAIPSMNEEIAEAVLKEKHDMYQNDDREFSHLTIYFYDEDYEAPEEGLPATDDAIATAEQTIGEETGEINIR
ncbi:MAG: lipoprotein [Tissierellia bacterium]|nr:lipoprotein [Tissierellia bacterium]